VILPAVEPAPVTTSIPVFETALLPSGAARSAS
jgi:hypothetical protein